jgi:hypothetical protein
VYYLSGAENPSLREAVRLGARVGIMAQPGNKVHQWADSYPAYAVDNACFAQGDTFDLGRYLCWLVTLPQRDHCLFATAPDVVGDAAATLRRAAPVLPVLRRLGFRAAFVAQDGLEALPVPWDDFDALFVGGTTAWKLSEPAYALVREAKARGKWAHQGRCNSERRLRAAAVGGYDSADGTFLKFGPDKNLPRLLGWLARLEGQARLPLDAA